MVLPKPGMFFKFVIGADSNLLQYGSSGIQIAKDLKTDCSDLFQVQLVKDKGLILVADDGKMILCTDQKVT